VYGLAGLPLAAAGFVGIVTLLAVGLVFIITPLGLWIIALAVRSAQGLGSLHRRLAAALLDEHVRAAQFRPAPGILGWRRGVLGDPVGWRAIGYLMLKLPVAILGCVVTVAMLAYGAILLSYPVTRELDGSVFRSGSGAVRHGLSIAGLRLDSWPAALAVSVAGAGLILLAPWAIGKALMPDRLLIRGLLGRSWTSERLQDLQETRARAVDDATATLRRIERDLHDGAQARLVALAMNLTMAREELAGHGSAGELARTRNLVDIAHQQTKEAISELRDLARGIRPPILDNGLGAALATLVTRGGVPVELSADIPVRPSAAIETIAYFCAAELLTNVARHSGARSAAVDVTGPDGLLRMTVTDDGTGGARPGDGSGLAGLASRVGTVDGRIGIDSPAGGPTVVTIELPTHA